MTSHHVTITSWISKFFQNVRKPPKITEKYSKSIKLREVKIIELKLIFTNGNKKLQIWKNISFKMTLPW